jgi:N-acetylneuraminic acid mutarotase
LQENKYMKKYFILLFATSLLSIFPTQQVFASESLRWMTKTPMPTGRWEFGTATGNNGKIYTIGGITLINGSSVVLDTVEEYNPASDVWTTKTSLPSPARYGLGAVEVNGEIYAIGGSGFPWSNQVNVYDPNTDTWSTKSSMLTSRANLGVARATNGKIYAIGGYNSTIVENHGILATNEEYNPETDTWTTKASMPTAREFVTVVASMNGKIYAIGGIGGGGLNTSDIVEEYDPVTDMWISRTKLPQSGVDGGGAVSADNGKIYLIGGYGNTPSVLEYDPIHDIWAEKVSVPMPMGRTFLGVAKGTNGKIYAIGGATPTASTVTEEASFFTTPQITSLDPAQVWIGLKNSDDVGIKFDLLAEAYRDEVLISSGQLNSVVGGSSGFNNAHIQLVPFSSFTPIDFPTGSNLSIKVYVRNACSGSGHNSGTARLWFNDSAVNSHFGATVDTITNNYFLLNNFTLGTTVGLGPKKTIDVAAGAKCSPFKSFGTWSTSY